MKKFVEKNCGRVLHECGVDGYLTKSMICLYDGSRACVRLDSRGGEYFEVRRGLRQRCVMSPWLFNILFNRLVKQLNEKAMGMRVELRGENGRG